MNPNHHDLPQLFQVVKAELSSRGFRVYPGPVVSTGAFAPWPDDRPIIGFLDFAKEFERRIIYLNAEEFTEEDALELLFLVSMLDLPAFEIVTPEQWIAAAGVQGAPEAEKFLQLAEEHRGELYRLSVQWVMEGVVHTYRVRADWHLDLELSAAELAELAESR